MKFYKFLRLFFCLSILFIPSYSALANESNHDLNYNDQIQKNENPRLGLKVTSFSVDADGNATGTLEDGTDFRQYTIFFDNNIRVQKFEMKDYYHYVVNDQIAYSLRELSILMGIY